MTGMKAVSIVFIERTHGLLCRHTQEHRQTYVNKSLDSDRERHPGAKNPVTY